MNQETTNERENEQNNVLQLLVYRDQYPRAFARIVSELSPEARAHLEARIARMEAEQAAREMRRRHG